MDILELRRRVGIVLAAEETQPTDWQEIQRLALELQLELVGEVDGECPDTVKKYLDDVDIRSRGDEAYATHQREEVRRFVTTGEFKNSKPVPLWTCAVVVLLVVALVVWLFW